MQLKRLTIHNIASIEDAVIDFGAAPLSDAEVFLITGRTGAGKSTILDAICLALYADTPRLDNTEMDGAISDGKNGKELKLNDPRLMLRRNTGEGWVELDFTGSDGVAYRAFWGASRARKKPDGNLQNKVWRLTRLDNGMQMAKDAEIKAAIAEAIGLDFKQFCRTTMLAQGEFTRFLNSNDEEKATILEKITGTEIYSAIGQRVFELTRKREHEYREMERKTKSVSLLSLEQRQALTDEAAALGQKAAEREKQREQLQTVLDWRRNIQGLEERIAQARRDREQALARTQTAEYEALMRLQSDWTASAEPRSWLRLKAEQEREAQRQAQALEDHGENFARLKASLLAHSRNVAKQLEQARSYEESRRQAEELEKKLASTDIALLRQRRDNCVKRISDLNSALRAVNALNADMERRASLRTELDQRQQRLEEAGKELDTTRAALVEATVARDAARHLNAQQRMAADRAAERMRAALQPGDTCPVCGQTVTGPLPQDEAMRELLHQTELHLDQAEKRYDELSRNLATLSAVIKEQTEALTLGRERLSNEYGLEKLQKETKELCELCGVDPAAENTAVLLEELKQKTAATERDVTEVLAEAEVIEQQLRQSSSHANRMAQVAAQAKQAAETLRLEQEAFATLIEMVPEWAQLTPAGSRQADGLLNRVNNLMGKVRAALELVEAEKEKAKATMKRVQQWADNHEGLTMMRLEYLDSLTSADVGAAQDRLDEIRNQAVAAQAALDQIEKQAAEMLASPPGEEWAALNDEELTEALSQTNDAINAGRQSVGALMERLEADDRQRGALSGMQKTTEARREEWLRWSKLNDLIGNATGTKFRRIAQSYVLDTLIHHANAYMTALTDRYTLEVTPGTFVISIADAWQGYTRRVASTLSGGESFLVSLALALALSDMGSRLAVDTLFIDEGFGTLSGDALAAAVDTLRALRGTSGRHVGIISHVDELRDRIGVQIRVEQHPGSASSKVEVHSPGR